MQRTPAHRSAAVPRETGGLSRVRRAPAAAAPTPAPHPMLRLQQAAGNQAVGRLLQAGLRPEHAPVVPIRGSTSRRANEAEADAAARAVAGAALTPLAAPDRAGLRPLPPRPAPAGLASGGAPLPEPARSRLEHAFGYDLGEVRLHDEALAQRLARRIGAAAFASGDHIAVAGPRFAPGHAQGEHILAHEVAHVIQTAQHPSAPAIHRYESPEHEDLGDAGLDDLLTFLETDAGAKWAKEHHLDAAKLVAQIKADPLKKAGGKIIAGTRKVGDKREAVGLTPGEIIALSGDFYASADDIAGAAKEPIAKLGDKSEIDKLREAIDQERRGQLKDANATYDAITKGRYIDLAKKNDVHFAPLNRAEWRRLHLQAMAEAAHAQDEDALQHALLVDTAGCHFLTDAYASGHLFKKDELLAAIDNHLNSNPLRTQNPEAQLYAGIVTLHGDANQLVLKAIHDRMNAEGFEIENAKGMKWKSFGDARLRDAPDTRRIASLAVFASRQQVYAARRGEKPDPAEVEALMPNDSTLEKATRQAIGYIPAAAADVQAVIYRGRDLAKTQFPFPLGAIVSSNLATIASPGRERQLLELEEASRTSNSGPRLAPQFTVVSW
jgi:Domain of unknown function (DUF4157)